MAAAAPVALFLARGGGESTPTRPFVGGDLHSLVVDPENPARLFVGGHHGVASSTDGGRTWRGLGGVPGATWVTWDPEDRGHIVASALGQTAETADGGRTWSAIHVPERASLVEMSLRDPRTLYAAVHEGDAAVVWVSRDGGRTWGRP